MPYDYYVFRRPELDIIFKKLNYQAAIAFTKTNDRQMRREAVNKMEKAARDAINIDPHQSYLWYWSKKDDIGQNKQYASEIAIVIQKAWQKALKAKPLPDDFHLSPDLSDIKYMSPLSFMLHIPFQLQKPYISKDEQDFYILDNPLRKEKIFQAPMVAATSWKGALRAALWHLGYKEEHESTIRLLGNHRNSEEYQAGRLYFYSTFFNEIGLEVINPHSRKTGVGEQPILIECVPKGVGSLWLLYVPVSNEQDEKERRTKVAQDLKVLAEGVQAMLTIYGFGAKTSSGFGIAQDQLIGSGTLVLRAKPASIVSAMPCPSEPEQLTLEREGRQPAEQATREQQLEAPPSIIATLAISKEVFPSLSEMREVARAMAAQLEEVCEA